MRKAFRTTIDENLLVELKKRAIDQNCNVNDVIEKFVMSALRKDYFDKHDGAFSEMSDLSKEDFLARKMKQSIDEILTTFGLDSGYVPHDIVDIMVRAIAQMAISKSRQGK